MGPPLQLLAHKPCLGGHGAGRECTAAAAAAAVELTGVLQ
jgi:hypothetical protein